jgi:phosphatidylinositol kinase/protein kinase (PI-3  family)
MSSTCNTWSKSSPLQYSSWIAKCCDLLEQLNYLEQDHILVWQIRLHHICDDALLLQKTSEIPQAQSEHHRNLIRMGLETQLREWQSRMPTNLVMQRKCPLE